MSTTSSTLQDVVDGYLAAYSETDAARRADLIARHWAEDGQLVDPPLTGGGHDGIAALAEAVQQQFAGHRFRRASVVDAHHDHVRFAWELIDPDGRVALTGTDFGELAADGRLRRIVGFFGPLAPAGAEDPR